MSPGSAPAIVVSAIGSVVNPGRDVVTVGLDGAVERWAPVPTLGTLDVAGVFRAPADAQRADRVARCIDAVRLLPPFVAAASRDQLTRRVRVGGVEHVITDDAELPSPLHELMVLVRDLVGVAAATPEAALSLSLSVDEMDEDWMASPTFTLRNIGAKTLGLLLSEDGFSVSGTSESGEWVSGAGGPGRSVTLLDGDGTDLGGFFDVARFAPGVTATARLDGALALPGPDRYSLVGALRLRAALPGVDEREPRSDGAERYPDVEVSLLAGPVWFELGVTA